MAKVMESELVLDVSVSGNKEITALTKNLEMMKKRIASVHKEYERLKKAFAKNEHLQKVEAAAKKYYDSLSSYSSKQLDNHNKEIKVIQAKIKMLKASEQSIAMAGGVEGQSSSTVLYDLELQVISNEATVFDGLSSSIQGSISRASGLNVAIGRLAAASRAVQNNISTLSLSLRGLFLKLTSEIKQRINNLKFNCSDGPPKEEQRSLFNPIRWLTSDLATALANLSGIVSLPKNIKELYKSIKESKVAKSVASAAINKAKESKLLKAAGTKKTQLLEYVGLQKSKLIEHAGLQKSKLIEYAGLQKSKLIEYAGLQKSKLIEHAGVLKNKAGSMANKISSVASGAKGKVIAAAPAIKSKAGVIAKGGVTKVAKIATTGGGLVAKAGSGMMGAIGGLMTGLKAIGAFLAANPIILIITAIVIVIILLYKNWDKVVAFIKLSIDWIMEKFALFKEYVIFVWDNIKEKAIWIWEEVKLYIEEKVEAIKLKFALFKEYLIFVWDNIKEKAIWIWEEVKLYIEEKIETIKLKFALFKEYLIFIWESIKLKVKTVWSNIKKSLTDKIEEIKEKFSDFKTKISEIFTGIKDSALKTFEPVLSRIESIKNGVKNVSGKFLNFFGLGKDKNGSHTMGLSYVPFDGYMAELHRGERVLTADENRRFSRGDLGKRIDRMKENQSIHTSNAIKGEAINLTLSDNRNINITGNASADDLTKALELDHHKLIEMVKQALREERHDNRRVSFG